MQYAPTILSLLYYTFIVGMRRSYDAKDKQRNRPV